MADDLAVTPGVGAKVSADEITTLNGSTVTAVLAQRVKVGWGIDGTFNDTNATNPLPVTSVVTSLPALATGANVIGGVTQSGTWNVGTVTTVTTVSTVTNLSQFGGAAINLGAGAVGTGTLRTTQASDSPLVAATGAIADAAWASGNGTLVAILKTIATAALDTTTASPVKIDQTTPGTTNAVSVQQPCDVITFTPTLDTSIYASGDTLFVATALSGVVRANDQRALLQSVAVIDKDDQKPALRLFFFSASITFGTLNAAPSISDADAANYLGHVDIAAADYTDLGGVSVACIKGINLLLESVAGATSVYIAGMLTAGTPTHTASGLVFRLGVVQS